MNNFANVFFAVVAFLVGSVSYFTLPAINNSETQVSVETAQEEVIEKQYRVIQAPPEPIFSPRPTIDKTLFSPPLKQPESEIPLIPEPEQVTWVSMGTFNISAYCQCVVCCEIWSPYHPSRVGTGYVHKTAGGTIPQVGQTIATDWSVIPFGTEVMINGHVYVAEDKGGAIKGNKIDILMGTHSACLEWGRQYVEVFIKK